MKYYFNVPLTVGPGDTVHISINEKLITFGDFKFMETVEGMLVIHYFNNSTSYYLF